MNSLQALQSSFRMENLHGTFSMALQLFNAINHGWYLLWKPLPDLKMGSLMVLYQFHPFAQKMVLSDCCSFPCRSLATGLQRTLFHRPAFEHL